jgi:hypothetical protein
VHAIAGFKVQAHVIFFKYARLLISEYLEGTEEGGGGVKVPSILLISRLRCSLSSFYKNISVVVWCECKKFCKI